MRSSCRTLLSAVPASHCVRSCEEIREPAVPLVHGAYYEVRPPGLDGTGDISLRDLVKFVLAIFRFSYLLPFASNSISYSFRGPSVGVVRSSPTLRLLFG